jgi:MFS family permease
LIAPFSVYAVEIVQISESQLGTLYTLNGLFVVLLQIPVTKLLSKKRFTHQLAWGSFIYAIGYSLVGIFPGYGFFIFAMFVITSGECFMSPPSLALTARLAPDDRMGRYMGIFGFFVTAGWSFGPLFGGVILDYLGHSPAAAWISISSMAVISGIGYLIFSKYLPKELDYKE